MNLRIELIRRLGMRPIKEIRHDNLLLLIEEAGSTSELANKTGIAVSYLLQIKNKNAIQNGKPKGIGDKIAAKLEDGMNKPRGWLDKAHSAALALPTQLHLADNIRFLMQKKGVSDLTALAQCAHIDVQALTDLMASPDEHQHAQTLQKLENFFIIDTQRLLYEDIAINPKGINFLKAKALPTHRVPIRGYTQLGPDAQWEEVDYPVGIGDGYILWPSRDQDVYALKCVGESMMPRIRHGEYVIIEPNHAVNNGDEVLVVTMDKKVMVKIFAYERDGMVLLQSINTAEFEAINLYRSDIDKMHYVAGIAKGCLVME